MQRIKSSYIMLICAICTLVLFVSGVFAAIAANTSRLVISTDFGPGIEGVVKLSTSTTSYQFSPDGETCFLPDNTNPTNAGYGSKLLFDNVSETTTQPTEAVSVAPISGTNFTHTMDAGVFVAYVYIENHTTAFAVNVVVTATADNGVIVDSIGYNSEEDAYADDDTTYDGTGFQLAKATSTAPSTTIVAVKFIVTAETTFNPSISVSLTEVQALA